jgi:hypothetical protein
VPPGGLVVNATNDYRYPMAAQLLVQNVAGEAKLNNFTVDGAGKQRRFWFPGSWDIVLHLAGVNEHAVLRIVGSKRWSVAYFPRTIQYLFEYGVRFLAT